MQLFAYKLKSNNILKYNWACTINNTKKDSKHSAFRFKSGKKYKMKSKTFQNRIKNRIKTRF